MKNKLVYKSKHGDIPILTRYWVPKNEVWFMNGEAPVDIFDKGVISLNIKSGLIKRVRFINKFQKRRMGKLTNIKGV